ncbi:cAMP-binding domain of CRP or a regulatory subunit of cAMP-dependent protein kinases [Tenacibaculum sp. MAR_2009_124]|uniref:Crp/Fnr family transcriptional regulator n=1 Tax=Tenacibaculum sp. MAR_2009_124 TaxID=1250059 RepID=UPI0008943293|nr:Crp/Fnr family transcriptional regulator [Tenacibaculum sp. MAR_2009_124]SEB51712.1 cAMP-binding domain of CRP or a regulatory subunit of cAMP-dependent protein kinases [Tenacibaculum sp. MAR_2009_124]
MNKETISQSIHRIDHIKKGNLFLQVEKPCLEIGMIEKGIMRGFVYDHDGNEVTTHFYQEHDMVIGSYIPNTNTTMSVQALEDCKISVANYSQVMNNVNKDREITEIITKQFQKLNHQLQARLVSLLNLNSVEKYALFLKEYPSLLNRIPHYYIANYLGITPTQLSRARKQFINKCK